MKKRGSYGILAIVVIVAIVALIVMIKPSSYLQAPSIEEDLVGEAFKKMDRDVFKKSKEKINTKTPLLNKLISSNKITSSMDIGEIYCFDCESAYPGQICEPNVDPLETNCCPILGGICVSLTQNNFPIPTWDYIDDGTLYVCDPMGSEPNEEILQEDCYIMEIEGPLISTNWIEISGEGFIIQITFSDTSGINYGCSNLIGPLSNSSFCFPAYGNTTHIVWLGNESLQGEGHYSLNTYAYDVLGNFEELNETQWFGSPEPEDTDGPNMTFRWSDYWNTTFFNVTVYDPSNVSWLNASLSYLGFNCTTSWTSNYVNCSGMYCTLYLSLDCGDGNYSAIALARDSLNNYNSEIGDYYQQPPEEPEEPEEPELIFGDLCFNETNSFETVDPIALTSSEDRLYVLNNNAGTDLINEYTVNGVETNEFNAPYAFSGGLTYLNGKLYVESGSSSSDNRIFVLNVSNGAQLDSFNPNIPTTQFDKLGSKGNNLLIAFKSSSQHIIYEYDFGNQSLVDTIDITHTDFLYLIYGLSYDPSTGTIFLSDMGNDYIWEVDTEGNALSAFDMRYPNIRGLTWLNSKLYVADRTDDRIYELTPVPCE